MTRTKNVAKYRRERNALAEFGKGEAFKKGLETRLTGRDSQEAIAEAIAFVAGELWGEIQWDLAQEAAQDEIDSGWAAERAAQHRWEQSAW
jgi:hypothetical protein